jgi:hypothetical protein
MKNKFKFLATITLAALIGFSMAGCGDTGGGPEGPGGDDDDLLALSITILRGESTATNFVFSVNQITGATYQVRALDGSGNPMGSPIGTWSGTKATITGNGLSTNAFTGFSVKAVKDGADASLSTKVPGMVKYSGTTDEVTVKGYTDWFKFLDGTITSYLFTVGSDSTLSLLRNDIRTLLSGGSFTAATALAQKSAADAAMTKVLNNWTAIWADLQDPDAAT